MGTDKALLSVGGRPLVLHVAARLARVARPVFLAPGRRGRLGALEGSYPELDDARPGSGPLGGVVAGLRASPGDLLAVVAGDMPFASPEVIDLLAASWSGEDAVVPVTEHGPEPLHALYARSALLGLEAALRAGRYGMRAALGDLRVRVVDEPAWRTADPSGRFAANLNRPEDLAVLASIPA